MPYLEVCLDWQHCGYSSHVSRFDGLRVADKYRHYEDPAKLMKQADGDLITADL